MKTIILGNDGSVKCLNSFRFRVLITVGESELVTLTETDMPNEKEWRNYFRPKKTLEKFGLREGMILLDLGCGYGTFSIAAARIVGKSGLVYSLDIDEKMINRVVKKAQSKSLRNIKPIVADISSLRNIELSADIALLANVIHGTRYKVQLLKRVKRLLKPKGCIVVMNWRVDENTPRGPPMKLRPTKEDTLEYLRKAGYESAKVLDMPPFHYAVVAYRSSLLEQSRSPTFDTEKMGVRSPKT